MAASLTCGFFDVRGREIEGSWHWWFGFEDSSCLVNWGRRIGDKMVNVHRIVVSGILRFFFWNANVIFSKNSEKFHYCRYRPCIKFIQVLSYMDANFGGTNVFYDRARKIVENPQLLQKVEIRVSSNYNLHNKEVLLSAPLCSIVLANFVSF